MPWVTWPPFLLSAWAQLRWQLPYDYGLGLDQIFLVGTVRWLMQDVVEHVAVPKAASLGVVPGNLFLSGHSMGGTCCQSALHAMWPPPGRNGHSLTLYAFRHDLLACTHPAPSHVPWRHALRTLHQCKCCRRCHCAGALLTAGKAACLPAWGLLGAWAQHLAPRPNACLPL